MQLNEPWTEFFIAMFIDSSFTSLQFGSKTVWFSEQQHCVHSLCRRNSSYGLKNVLYETDVCLSLVFKLIKTPPKIPKAV